MQVAPYENRRRVMPWPNLGGLFNRVPPYYRPVAQYGVRALQAAYRGYRARQAVNRLAQIKKEMGPAPSSAGTRFQPNNAGGGVAASAKKNRKRKAKKSGKLSKTMKKRIKAVANAADWEKLTTWQNESMRQWASDINKINFIEEQVDSVSAWKLRLLNPQILTASNGVSTVVMQDPSDLASANVYKKFKIESSSHYWFKNNTNSPTNMIIYKLRCEDDTNNGPFADLTARWEQQYALNALTPTTPAPPPDIETDIFQYWTTTSMKAASWKMIKKTEVRLNPGDEYHYYDSFTFILDTKNLFAVNHVKGMPGYLLRFSGVPSHDTADSAFLGLSNTLTDGLRKVKYTVFSKDGTSLSATKNILERDGFDLTNPVTVTEDTVGSFDKT